MPNHPHSTVLLTTIAASVVIASAFTAWPGSAAAHARHSTTGHEAPAIERGGRMALVFPPADALPDPRLTPGALNPAVTQANLRQTICRSGGYTRSIRPPEGYTEKLKRRQIRQYGYARQMGSDGDALRNYEEDHLISLEIGGSPDSPRNLWPEPHHVIGGWGSYVKDQLENRLHRLVCSGQVSLVDAQRMLANNWIDAYKRYVSPIPIERRSHQYGG